MSNWLNKVFKLGSNHYVLNDDLKSKRRAALREIHSLILATQDPEQTVQQRTNFEKIDISKYTDEQVLQKLKILKQIVNPKR